MSRKTYWLYADVSCAAYMLKDVDTIADNGKMNDLSALYLIVNGVCIKIETMGDLSEINSILF